MPSKKSRATRTKQSTFVKRFRAAANSKALKRILDSPGTRIGTVAIICVMGVGLLVAARRPAPSDETVSTRAADRALAADAAASSSLEPAVDPSPKAEAVTVTGCLEQANDMFRLKDTAGADAPKSRSWKSGFLKKRPAQIDVVDARRRLKLPAHVGERVSVTGVMTNREMQARSLQRVGASCS